MNSKIFKVEIGNLKNSYVFDGSQNKYGTIKDLRNKQVVEEAKKLHVDKLVLITSGNSGYSLAEIAKDTGIKVVCVINKNIDDKIKALLKNVAYQVIELNLDQKILRPEELIAFTRETDDEVIWDVTNGYEDAYISIVAQICKSFKPDYIVCPLGSGGIYMGIIEGVEKYSSSTKVIGIGVKSVYQSVADKLSTPWSPYTRAIETKNANGHMVFRLSEDEIKKTFYQYKNIATSEVSATVVYAAPTLYKFKPTDKVVFINSGKLMPKITA